MLGFIQCIGRASTRCVDSVCVRSVRSNGTGSTKEKAPPLTHELVEEGGSGRRCGEERNDPEWCDGERATTWMQPIFRLQCLALGWLA